MTFALLYTLFNLIFLLINQKEGGKRTMAVINTNYLSLVSQSNLQKSQGALSSSIERLSSGLRINSARDGFQLNFSAKIAQQLENSRFQQNTISVLQTAEGGLSGTQSLLSRMKELANQAADGTLDETGRAALQQEFTAVNEEITRIAEQTMFGQDKLLDGSLKLVTQTSNFGGQNSSIKIDDMSSKALGLSDVSISSSEDAQNTLIKIDEAIEKVSEQRSSLGKEQNIVSNLSFPNRDDNEKISAVRSRITDADFAAETSKLTRGQILAQAGAAILAQANSVPQSALSLLR